MSLYGVKPPEKWSNHSKKKSPNEPFLFLQTFNGRSEMNAGATENEDKTLSLTASRSSAFNGGNIIPSAAAATTTDNRAEWLLSPSLRTHSQRRQRRSVSRDVDLKRVKRSLVAERSSAFTSQTPVAVNYTRDVLENTWVDVSFLNY